MDGVPILGYVAQPSLVTDKKVFQNLEHFLFRKAFYL